MTKRDFNKPCQIPTLGDRYLGLFFFDSIPIKDELEETFRTYNERSKHGIMGAAIHISSQEATRGPCGCIIVNSGHHLEPLLELPAAWTIPVQTLLSVEVSLGQNVPPRLLDDPTSPLALRVVRWPFRLAELTDDSCVKLLCLASTISIPEPIVLYPSHMLRVGNKVNRCFHWSWSWQRDSAAQPRRRKQYDALLSEIDETYCSDAAYLSLRLMRLKGMLTMRGTKARLGELLLARTRGVLSAIEDRISNLRSRYSVVIGAAFHERDALVEADGAFGLSEEASRVISIIEDVVLTRSLGRAVALAATGKIEDELRAVAIRAIDRVLADVSASMRGTSLYVLGRKPGKVVIPGETFRAVHDDLKQLVGQYREVYWDENLAATEQHVDLAHRGAIECYEVPTRLLLRSGAWPLVTRPLVETGLTRLSDVGQFRLKRIYLDLLKWWSRQRQTPLAADLSALDSQWPRRAPSQSTPEGVIGVYLRAKYPELYPVQLSRESLRELFAAYEALVDLICTRVMGPAYVYALARFGLRGTLATGDVSSSALLRLGRHELLTSEQFGELAGRLANTRERLSVCLSTLETAGLQIRSLSSLLLDQSPLGPLENSIIAEVDRLIVRKPYNASCQKEAQDLASVLSRGQIAEGRPVLLLNALWYAVTNRKLYLNEPALVLTLARSVQHQK